MQTLNSSADLHRKRLRAEQRFRWYGRGALGLALLMLALLLATLIARGLPGFTQVQMKLPITFNTELLATDSPQDAPSVSAFMRVAQESLRAQFPHITDPDQQRALSGLMSGATGVILRDAYQPEWLGTTREMTVPASALLGAAYKADRLGAEGALSEEQQGVAQTLKAEGRLSSQFNVAFLTQADSRQPERAGMMGAMVGSLLTIAACLALAFPLGVMTAVYLEEFARRGLLRDAVEVNINNLAAVPSIVFGLLGLAVFINMMHMPRSAPIVGGLTLALMILPVIIIATRSSLRAVPDSIRQAALALGASPLQVVWHHTLPLALPGIMTGTILGIARALGETAPLLMIGMVAFVADIPTGFTSSATVMPVQIYLWAGSPEAGFAEKTAAGILVLILLLLALNALAIYIRRRFEVRW